MRISLKLPSELTIDDFIFISPKLTWDLNVKHGSFSINMVSAQAPICLCHLLMF